MGWNNEPIPWRELERRLSGRPGPSEREVGEYPTSHKRPKYQARKIEQETGPLVPYAELHAHSSFSFLDGASEPADMVEEAVRLRLDALTLIDHDGMYGVVRFHEAAVELGMPTVFGAELSLDIPVPSTQTERMIAARVGEPDPPGRHLLVLAKGVTGYTKLSSAISTANLRGGSKGRPVHDLDELTNTAGGDWLILTGCRKGPLRAALEAGRYGTFALDPARRALAELIDRFGRDNVAVELTYAREPVADERYEALVQLAREADLRIVATTEAHYDRPERRELATTVAAVRARSSLDEMDGWLPAWADQHLRSGAEMAERFKRWPDAIENTVELSKQLVFELDLLAPNLPPFPLKDGHKTEMSYLRHLAYDGAASRYAGTAQEEKAYRKIKEELDIIEQLNFPGYFLVVWDIARFCRERNILCQGRGSAANSAVCYALGVTAVDAVYFNLMFERFLGPERSEEPPDIDIDIESDRREEVIQYVYETHGRERAAQVANVITYRPKSAIRDVARAFGYSQGQQDAWSKEFEQGYYWSEVGDVDIDIPAKVLELSRTLERKPRHLGIHSGGMVICDRPIVEVCPVEWGRMPNRTVLQWDKDDCASMKLVKFDLLGLGMLSALKYCFELVEAYHHVKYDLDSIPKEQKCVYDMLHAADAVGVFQVESRAQLATLPRLKPDNLYELAIEVALIRPGPIQGDSVHPYIRRKRGTDPIAYAHDLLKKPLKRTLGIPLFQEQLMEIAITVAGFSPAEADRLRRAMGSKRGVEKIVTMRERLYQGMARNGVTGKLADEIYDKIQAFSSFGFAESHAISFALLVYASAWLKRHYPAAFCAALLNAQPMGFYSPQSLVHDAKRHGVDTRRPDINRSAAGASLEKDDGPVQCDRCPEHAQAQPAVRLGLQGVRTIGTELAEAIVAERDANGPFTSMADLSRRVGLSGDQVEALATAGAFDSFGASRRAALWGAGAAATARPGQLELATFDESATPELPIMTEPEELLADMWATTVTPERYPTSLIRDRLDALGIIPAAQLAGVKDHARITVGGVVTHRQRPSTAHGVTFINLEDETGMVNIVCHASTWDRYRRVARQAGGLVVRGRIEKTDEVINVVAQEIEPLPLGLRTKSRDFR
ncbi:MAG TPA: error-prone DNA polymerase [Jatrophihabitantaceae bacterium]|jgi:error-prone DNA polymerase